MSKEKRMPQAIVLTNPICLKVGTRIEDYTG
jgi:hypothetical protein